MPASRNFVVWIGNVGVSENPAGIVLVYKAGTPAVAVDLTGYEIVFRLTNAARVQILRKTSADAGITLDAVNGKITVPFTVAETRALRLGEVYQYEIEARITGSERTLLSGRITTAGGINDDAG